MGEICARRLSQKLLKTLRMAAESGRGRRRPIDPSVQAAGGTHPE